MVLFVLLCAFQSSFILDWQYVHTQQPDTILSINEQILRECHDAWTSQDKFLHFSVSTALSGFSYYYLISRSDTEYTTARLYSLSFGAFAGLAKEIYDSKTMGYFSWKDIVWDGVGLCVAFLMFMR